MNRATPESVGMSSARLERIGPAMQACVDKGAHVGVHALVARKGVVVHSSCHGFRDREARVAMTPDTIFRLYSMTKPIVCTALMMLYEEGRLRLVDPVARHIPSFAGVKVLGPDGGLVDCRRPMTVRDLLVHTSGLSYGFLEDSPVCDLYSKLKLHDAGVALAEAIDDLATFPLAFQPGSRWHYSVGIDVAARVIEVVSGQKLADFLTERLFGPLGMVDTAFHAPPEKRARVATVYAPPSLRGGVKFSKALALWKEEAAEPIDLSESHPVDAPDTFPRGGHGLFGTAADYLRFAQMLLEGGELDGRRYLSRKTLQLMHSNHVPTALFPLELGGFPMLGYGFGLGSRVALDAAAGGASTSVGEFGWGGAAKTYYWVDPVEKIVGLFMAQSLLSFDLSDMDLRAIVYGALVD